MTGVPRTESGLAGAHVAASTNSYHSHRLEDALAGIAEAGFSYVELAAVRGWTEHVDLTVDPGAIRSLLEKAQLQAISLSAHSDLTTKEGRAYLALALRWASNMGIGLVNTSIGGHAGATDDRGAFLAAAPELIDLARRTGVVIALETHGAVMGSGEAALDILAQVDSEWVRLNYDTANVEYYAGVTAASEISRVVSYIACLHLKDHVGGRGDWNFPALGDGLVDFTSVFHALREADYSGPMGVEIEFWGEPWPPLPVIDYAMARSFRYLQLQGLV